MGGKKSIIMKYSGKLKPRSIYENEGGAGF
jgi:hypothetical protein